MKQLTTTIPFDGFYYSCSNDIIERALGIDDNISHNIQEENPQLKNETDQEYIERIDNLCNEAIENAPYKEACEQYCKEYVESFARDNKIKLDFADLDSPKEYNFVTDRIFCTITVKEVKRLIAKCDKQKLAELIKEKFTSCSGFISSYSNDINEWPLDQCQELDHNQIGTIIECVTAEHIHELTDGGNPYEWHLMSEFTY